MGLCLKKATNKYKIYDCEASIMKCNDVKERSLRTLSPNLLCVSNACLPHLSLLTFAHHFHLFICPSCLTDHCPKFHGHGWTGTLQCNLLLLSALLSVSVFSIFRTSFLFIYLLTYWSKVDLQCHIHFCCTAKVTRFLYILFVYGSS